MDRHDEWTRSRPVQEMASIMMIMTDEELGGVLKGERDVKSEYEETIVPEKIGDRGDCGNFAIALKRFLGKGTCYGIFDGGESGDDSNPILEHVVLDLGEGEYLDALGTHDYHGIYEDVYWCWGYYPLDLVKITESEIFEKLPETSETRIKELVNGFREKGIILEKHVNFVETYKKNDGRD